MLLSYVSYMNVKIADLKNNLSRYLATVSETGVTIIICDRDKPIATLTPLVRDDDSEWQREREECLARARKIGLKIEIPLTRPDRSKKPKIVPRIAPDGRTDIHTIDLVRKGRDY
jgi:antitoxin (DNA-binding transcriptional repressor) of toxin-antitoxin stability system